MCELDKEINISPLSVRSFCSWNRQLISSDAQKDWRVELGGGGGGFVDDCRIHAQKQIVTCEWCILLLLLFWGVFCVVFSRHRQQSRFPRLLVLNLFHRNETLKSTIMSQRTQRSLLSIHI